MDSPPPSSIPLVPSPPFYTNFSDFGNFSTYPDYPTIIPSPKAPKEENELLTLWLPVGVALFAAFLGVWFGCMVGRKLARRSRYTARPSSDERDEGSNSKNKRWRKPNWPSVQVPGLEGEEGRGGVGGLDLEAGGEELPAHHQRSEGGSTCEGDGGFEMRRSTKVQRRSPRSPGQGLPSLPTCDSPPRPTPNIPTRPPSLGAVSQVSMFPYPAPDCPLSPDGESTRVEPVNLNPVRDRRKYQAVLQSMSEGVPVFTEEQPDPRASFPHYSPLSPGKPSSAQHHKPGPAPHEQDPYLLRDVNSRGPSEEEEAPQQRHMGGARDSQRFRHRGGTLESLTEHDYPEFRSPAPQRLQGGPKHNARMKSSIQSSDGDWTNRVIPANHFPASSGVFGVGGAGGIRGNIPEAIPMAIMTPAMPIPGIEQSDDEEDQHHSPTVV